MVTMPVVVTVLLNNNSFSYYFNFKLKE
jgi:hypothetical protein